MASNNSEKPIFSPPEYNPYERFKQKYRIGGHRDIIPDPSGFLKLSADSIYSLRRSSQQPRDSQSFSDRRVPSGSLQPALENDPPGQSQSRQEPRQSQSRQQPRLSQSRNEPRESQSRNEPRQSQSQRGTLVRHSQQSFRGPDYNSQHGATMSQSLFRSQLGFQRHQ